MSNCPLCGDTVAKFAISFHAEFMMCSNEDCVYPFQDDTNFKASIIDKRPPGALNASRKRKALSTPEDSTSDANPKLTKKPRPVDSLKTKSSKKPLSGLSAAPTPPSNIDNSISAIPTADSAVALSTMTSIPSIESSTASLESITTALDGLDAIIAASSTKSTATQPVTQSSIPASPVEAVPDLIFDFLPSGSWTTPVTPPDKPAHSDINSKANVMGSSLGSATATAKSLETLLFDDEFDIDFGALQGVDPALEFDPDFEAMLRQQL
ncbi:hypothetical protein BGZ80_008746 [Entomortierella chlamydospora]|uniref:Uncharacterized protein n=1 Tax=Entomortierella chlamydospora TaxID=101097 RepID=A0A9P6MY65_9FUNG|nr:hypothetical protein BGZ80_008746 [Entomortierella chlamydospora]